MATTDGQGAEKDAREPDLLWGDLAPAGPCYICNDARDHDGLPHGTVTGDGRVRADVTRPIPPGACGICGGPLDKVGTSRCYEAHGVIPPGEGDRE